MNWYLPSVIFWLAMVVRALRAAEDAVHQGAPRIAGLEQHAASTSQEMVFAPPRGDR